MEYKLIPEEISLLCELLQKELDMADINGDDERKAEVDALWEKLAK